MKKEHLKWLGAMFIVLFMVLVGCNDDDDDGVVYINGFDSTTIIIDDDSAFNMVNFAMCFEQLFTSNDRWMWNYSHKIVNGFAVETYVNVSHFGKFGQKMATITHQYNTEGIIVSSVRTVDTNYYFDDDEVTFTYKYDAEGFIKELTKTEGGSVRDVVTFTYNDQKQLIKKDHEERRSDELFTYNDLGYVETYVRNVDEPDNYKKYNYDVNGNMVNKQYFNENVLDFEFYYEYDSSGRLIQYTHSGDNWVYYYEYTNDYVSFKYTNDTGQISYKEHFDEHMRRIKRWAYRYDYNTFLYCETAEFEYIEGHDRRLTTKKEYYNGTPENLTLVGYVIVDTRDAANEYKKTKESIYDANDTLLYYVTYEVSNNSFQSHQLYYPDGTEASDSEISGELSWIATLVSSLD